MLESTVTKCKYPNTVYTSDLLQCLPGLSGAVLLNVLQWNQIYRYLLVTCLYEYWKNNEKCMKS